MIDKNILPKHWQVKKLGEIGKCVTGTTPPKNDANNYGNDTPFVKPPQLFDKPINDAPEKLSKKGSGLARILPINSVLVTCIGNLGRTAINKIPVAFNQQINAIIPSENIDGRFLFYQAQSSDFRNQLEDLSAATTVAIVNKGKFETIEIKFPPLTEQRVIVSKIEELLSDLENGKQQLQTAQQQLKIYRQSLLKWAFEGKLTRLNYDSKNEIKNNQVNHTNQKNHSSDNLPKGWKLVKVSEICNVVRGGSPRPAGDPKFYNGNIPFLKVRDITKDNNTYLTTFEYTIKEAGLHKTRRISPNTLLLSNSGATLGVPKICMIDATMNDGIAAFLDLDQRSNRYLYYFWMSKTKELRNINMGAAQPNLNTDIIKNYLVPYCSFEEQQRIVDELESKLTVCDKIEETISQSLQQAETLRQSILKKAFEGKLV